MILAARFTFIVEKSWKNMYFYSKMAWTPPTYDVISRNHRNGLSSTLTQHVCEGWMNSYWKHHVPMLYPPGENSEKPYLGGGGGGRWQPPPLSRPRISILVFAVLVTYCRRQRDYHFLQLPNQLLKGSLPPSLMMTTIKTKPNQRKG